MDELELADETRSIMDIKSKYLPKGEKLMDEEMRVSEQAEEVLRGKLEELDYMDASSEDFSAAAEGVNKVANAYATLKQEERNKKEGLWKFLGIAAGVLTGIGAAVIKALCDQKINQNNLDYLDASHQTAYEFEKTGETNHIVVSPAAKDALRENPKSLK